MVNDLTDLMTRGSSKVMIHLGAVPDRYFLCDHSNVGDKGKMTLFEMKTRTIDSDFDMSRHR